MKIYRESSKKVLTAGAVIVLLAVVFFCFRTVLTDLVRVSWNLTVGENKVACTPQDRMNYLEKHPKQIRIAILGNRSDQIAGKMYRQTLSLAIDRINQAGGIRDRLIVPEWMDTEESAKELNEYVEEIAYDPSYYAVIWAGTSGQLLTVKPLLLTYQLLTMAPGIGSISVVRPSDPPCIFLPNASDVQEVMLLSDWAKKGSRNNFVLINEYQPFATEYAKHVERVFFENRIDILARSIYNPADNINFFLDMLKINCDFFDIRHTLIINHSRVPETYERMAKWMLTNIGGDIFFHTPIRSDFSEEDLKRIFSFVYYDLKDAAKIYHELESIQYACFDPAAILQYRSVFLLADACSQAKSLHQDDVIDVLRKNELKSPFGVFRFDDARFEKDPVLRIVSIHEFFSVWMKGLTTRPKLVK